MKQKQSLWTRIKKHRWSYIFIAPKMILFFGLSVYPIVMSWVYSFFNWSGMEPLTDFVGWENFIAVASDSVFWQAFKNSFIYTLGVVPIQLFLALLAAIILNNRDFRGSSFYRTVLFIPVITTTAIVGIVMSFIFGSYNGVVNEALMKLNLIKVPIDWLADGRYAMLVVIGVGIWKTFGYNLVYWLAGLQSIPQELYEAAKVDGANGKQQFWYVTLPMLKPIGMIILLLAIVGSLNVFDLVKVMTNGGPAYATEVVGTYIYRYAFSAEEGIPRLGLASAAGIFYGVTIMVIGIIQSLVMKKVNRERA
jgi:multiple sugar transport system permease protein